MKKKRIYLPLLALSLTLSVAAHAAEPEEASEKKSEAKSADKDDNFGHRFQFGLRAGLVGGYLMDFRYDKSPLCRAYDFSKSASDQQKFCGRVAPLAVDLGLSFALLDFFEPFV